MMATTLSTGTVSPASARTSARTPPAGDGTSASTLSVETSNSGSSRSTRSPTRLFHRTIVPSAMDSPSCGMSTSLAIGSLQSDGRKGPEARLTRTGHERRFGKSEAKGWEDAQPRLEHPALAAGPGRQPAHDVTRPGARRP